MQRRRVAIVGSGVAGLTCAHVLGPHHEVVLYEADDRLGGHANTVTVDDPDAGRLAVDTGFIVHNDRNYPQLLRLLADLGVDTQPSEMSFAVHDPAGGLHYRATNPRTIFADRSSLLRRDLWRLLADVPRFWWAARRLLRKGDEGLSLADFLDEHRFSPAFVDLHLIPMGAAVWSANPTTFDEFPAVRLFRFLENHGLLGLGRRPAWRTVVGGSRAYVERISERFPGEIRLGDPVSAVRRINGRLEVVSRRDRAVYDTVVLAAHSDQSLRLLDDTHPARDVLSAIRYQANRAVLHTDTSLLGPIRGAWAAWNVRAVPKASTVEVTYDLTLLQRLDGAHRYLVTLNQEAAIDPDRVLAAFDYAHPVFDSSATAAQRRLGEVNGADDVYFCGAWCGYGFHEDGVVAALEVCRRLGVDW